MEETVAAFPAITDAAESAGTTVARLHMESGALVDSTDVAIESD